ncbi:hypothetical protein [Actinopolymorpha rutila]|uniref:Uncharacterized protein n=1 Tax=Actinopolymorpha rutila TaxID=446787 RepID=A0A852ZGA2_9ACTN|nr:hypothetical protein [Actinopolymorpha rutila]NYH91195.1 hypothetical protein [Actinopolymorpha rutila]
MPEGPELVDLFTDSDGMYGQARHRPGTSRSATSTGCGPTHSR